MATQERTDPKVFNAVVDRAMDMFQRHGTPVPEKTLRMDLMVVEMSDCGLDFDGLLKATPFDFSHDIVGIVQHMDRENMKLGGCFTPRYAKHQ